MAKETIDRLEIFKEELRLIEDQELWMLAKCLLEQAPEYYFSVPASSTGKYHPPFAQGQQGLVRHVKASIIVAQKLWPAFILSAPELHLEEMFEEVVIALLFHDVLKRGLSCTEHTLECHAEEAAAWVQNQYSSYVFQTAPLIQGSVIIITELIKTHMGTFGNTKFRDDYIGALQRYVHLCDYISSRTTFLTSMLLAESGLQVNPTEPGAESPEMA